MKQGSTKLTIFATVIISIAIIIAATVFANANFDHSSIPWIAVAALMLGLIIGDLIPVELVSQGRNQRVMMTYSNGFGMAMIAITPLAVIIPLFFLLSIVDEIKSGFGYVKTSFNIGQPIIIAAIGSYAIQAVSGKDQLSLENITGKDLAALVVGCLAFAIANHVLVNVIAGLAMNRSVLRMLRDDSGIQVLAHGLDLGIAPMALALLVLSPWTMPLLLLPPWMMHRSAKIASLREKDATHDVLTGLANRSLLPIVFNDHKRDIQEGEIAIGVYLIDLDHFKDVNDSLGHQVGDRLLCEVAERLLATVRKDDTVARLGGDEFAIIAPLRVGREKEEATELAERIVEVLNKPMVLKDVQIGVHGSVGFALAPEQGNDIETLLSKADIALYTAKQHRGRAKMFVKTQDAQSDQKLALLADIKDAVYNDEFEVLFQPIIDLHSGEIVRIAAAQQWVNSARGNLNASEYVTIADNAGILSALNTHLLSRALDQVQRWRAQEWNFDIGVTLPTRVLKDSACADEIQQLLAERDLPGEVLTIEITEDAISGDSTRSLAIIGVLRSMGVNLSLTRYGEGVSSLGKLRSWGISEIKIAPSYISGIGMNNESDIFVSSVFAMASIQKIRVVAEGIETMLVWERLIDMGCPAAQGMAVCRPVSAEELAAWLKRRSLKALHPRM